MTPKSQLPSAPVIDGLHLQASGRAVVVPFRVRLRTGNDHIVELVCTRVLRVLPGKRLVCLGECDADPVVVKFFLDPRRSKAHCAREERGITALKKRNIKTPDLLFKGTIRPNDVPVLVFQQVTQAQDMDAVWKQTSDACRHNELLCRAVAVIAEQHETGMKQDDLHMGNFLFTQNDIYTIDGDSVYTRRSGRPLSTSMSLKNLGLFFAQFGPRFDCLVPKAFCVYTEKRDWPEDRGRYLRLVKEIHKQRNWRKNRYLKKIYRECSAFVRRKTWNRFVVCDRNYYNETMEPLLNDPDSMIKTGRMIKKGNTSTVSLVEAGGQRFVVKRYNIKNIQHAIGRSFRSSRASVSWRNGHRLRFLGIFTPEPVALIEKRRGPFRSEAYFITEYVDGIDACRLFHSEASGHLKQKEVVKEFGKLVQALSDAFISHGDSKATNFLVTKHGLSVIDLDSMAEHRLRWRFKKAFARDCKRFMKNWMDLPEVFSMFHDEIKKV